METKNQHRAEPRVLPRREVVELVTQEVDDRPYLSLGKLIPKGRHAAVGKATRDEEVEGAVAMRGHVLVEIRGWDTGSSGEWAIPISRRAVAGDTVSQVKLRARGNRIQRGRRRDLAAQLRCQAR
jgi:hypothetical protein